MAGVADLLGSVWPWALVVGAILAVPGWVLFGLGHLQAKRLLPRLRETHPAAWQHFSSRKRRLFEWSPPALRSADAALDARLLRIQRLQHVGGALMLPGFLLLVLADFAWMFS